MGKGRAICFVVVLMHEGKKYYFESEEVGLIDPKTHETIREPQGFFCDNLIKAQKYLDKWRAEMVASAYEGARVETIKTGEVLK